MMLQKGKASRVVIVVLIAFGLMILICKAPELFRKRSDKIQLSQKAYDVIRQYEQTVAPKMSAFTSSDGLNDLAGEIEARLRKEPKNTWARLQLAILYKTQNQWRKAIEHFTIANAQSPDIADPLTGIGLVLYELSLFDMTDRKLYKQAKTGLPVFLPDQEAKALLLESRGFLERAKKLTVTYRSSQAKRVYNFGPGAIDEHLRLIEQKLQVRAPKPRGI
jgi:tetratricopeptide (TPR) repeat protein